MPPPPVKYGKISICSDFVFFKCVKFSILKKANENTNF